MLLIKGMIAKEAMKESVRDFFKKESGEVNVVAIIVLIAVAIAIALIFKDQLTGLVNILFEGLTKKGKDAVTNM